MLFSPPVRVLFAPFRGYRELAASEVGPVRPILRALFVVGVFVSVSASGRFLVPETAFAMLSFSWLILVYGASLLVTLRLIAPQVSRRHALGLYFEGQGPWLALFLFLSGACLFAPHPARPVFVLLGPLLLGAVALTLLLTFAFFHAALALTRARAAVGTVLVHAGAILFALGYFLAAGQLWPIL